VPLFDLKFLNELAVGGAGTSIRRHYWPASEVRDALQHALMRILEANGHEQVYSSGAAFRFEVTE
jgi:hypothetical protein